MVIDKNTPACILLCRLYNFTKCLLYAYGCWWMDVWVRVLRLFQQYFSHFETMEGWTWKAQCNEAPSRFGKNLASSGIRTRDPVTARPLGRFYGCWWYSNLKQYVLETKAILRLSVVCQHFQTASADFHFSHYKSMATDLSQYYTISPREFLKHVATVV